MYSVYISIHVYIYMYIYICMYTFYPGSRTGTAENARVLKDSGGELYVNGQNILRQQVGWN